MVRRICCQLFALSELCSLGAFFIPKIKVEETYVAKKQPALRGRVIDGPQKMAVILRKK